MIGLVGCSKEEKPVKPAHVHYKVGQPYSLGENWFYPEESFSYQTTGIAVVSKKQEGALTADGEYYDPKSMTGAHPTLQLPSIVRVRNLDNGREITIRLNDRPSSVPVRLLELTPQAADLLQIPVNGTARIEMTENERESQDLAFQMPDGPQTQMQVNSAPLDRITVESLDGATKTATGQKRVETVHENDLNRPVTLPNLPVVYTQGPITGGQLWIDCGSFTLRVYAERLAARIGGRLVYTYEGGRQMIHVRSGPYQTVRDADINLDYLLKSGIKSVKIVVE